MLVSHVNKFIYIKPLKAAGSSVEAWFQKFCLSEEDRKKLDQSVWDACRDDRGDFQNKNGIIGGRLSGSSRKFPPHSRPREIKNIIGKEKFDEYFKFSVVRNPWDRMVSMFWWKHKKKNGDFKAIKKCFNEWMTKSIIRSSVKSDLELYTIRGEFIFDYYIRYENLEQGIREVCDLLDIKDIDLSRLPKHKSGYRKFNNHYSEYYEPETAQIVKDVYGTIIDYFDYSFEEKNIIKEEDS